jgi:hypothetical protein
MTKREAEAALTRLERAGWRSHGLIRWDSGSWSVSVIGRDGGTIRLDSAEAVAERLADSTDPTDEGAS